MDGHSCPGGGPSPRSDPALRSPDRTPGPLPKSQRYRRDRAGGQSYRQNPGL